MADLNPKQRNTLRVALVTLSGLLLIGTLLFHSLENWTWTESFYFTVITLTTVGYGDLHPTTDASRLAVALFIIFGVGIVAGVVSMVGSGFLQRRVKRRAKRLNIDDQP